MGFKEEIQLLSQKIKQNKDLIKNEEGTKQFLIIDFIEALGYDTRDPNEFQPEFSSGYGNKQGHRVDYALLKEGKPIVFIEAKPVTKSLEEHDEQLEYYFNNNLTAKLGILANGDEYRFFTDLENDNRMDKRPFLTVRLSDLKETDIENLEKLKKENYNVDSLATVAEQLHYATEINAQLKELMTNPPEDFIRILIKKIKPDKKISKPMLERLKPIVKIAIQNSISEMTRHGIEDQQIEAQISLQQKSITAKKEEISQKLPDEAKTNQKDTEKLIETTEEEIKGFEIVKSILQKSGRDVSKLFHKDTTNYLSINNRVTTGWFLRLIFRDNKKSVDVRIDTPNLQTLVKGLQIKEYPPAGVTNITINSVDDLKKLEKLIIVCFDEVNK